MLDTKPKPHKPTGLTPFQGQEGQAQGKMNRLELAGKVALAFTLVGGVALIVGLILLRSLAP